MSDERPVGMFDSGVGGLAVLREVRRRLPAESVVYVADQAWAPYGDRSLGEVRERSVEISAGLIRAGSKLVVVACNSASAAALHHLREVFPDTPFVGMEPAVKPAALESRSGVIGVIATRATFQGELFAAVVDRHANGITVLAEPVAGLVEWVERGEDPGGAGERALTETLAAMVDRGMDTLVLGCTHYSFLEGDIRRLVGDRVSIVDPAGAVARQVGRVLDRHGLAGPPGASGSAYFHTTLDPRRLADSVFRLTGVAPEAPPASW